MSIRSSVLIGEGSLLAACGDLLLDKGQVISGVITREPSIEIWAAERSLPLARSDAPYVDFLKGLDFDDLFAIAHLSMVPDEALQLVRGRAVNFHDGPLPRYAGLNAPSWALLHGEPGYGVTWHEMVTTVDAGRILEQRLFQVSPGETAFSLNAKCYDAGLQSFGELVDKIVSDSLQPVVQDLSRRTTFRAADRPPAAATIDWTLGAEKVAALVAALSFGTYRNPICLPKVYLGDGFLAPTDATATGRRSTAPPGTVVSVAAGTVGVATSTHDVELKGIRTLAGAPVAPADLGRRYGLAPGQALPSLPPSLAERLTALSREGAPFERGVGSLLASPSVPELALEPGDARAPAERADAVVDPARLAALSPGGGAEVVVAALAVFLARRSGSPSFDVLYTDSTLTNAAEGTLGAFVSAVPVRIAIALEAPFAAARRAVAEALGAVRRQGPYASDLPARTGASPVPPPGAVSIAVGVAPAAADVEIHVAADGATCGVRVTGRGASAAGKLARQIEEVLKSLAERPDRPIAEAELASAEERAIQLGAWNDTERALPATCLHELFAEQVARTPEAVALVSRDRRMSYRALEERANRLAHHLQELGVGPEVPVGVMTDRSFAMVEAVLGILKAGGAYVPLDPAYPADRIAFMASDAGLRTVLTESHLLSRVPGGVERALALDTLEPALAQHPVTPVPVRVEPHHLAYVIYTSGSSGRPKGVMVEHENVVNFGVGMDDHVRQPSGGVWLAVTSLSFDISVLELLWTLTRGFTVVLHRDEPREAFVSPASGPPPAMSFSLMYFSSDEGGRERDKYRLLLEGARFADSNGLVAVWTPERHFHAFGGLFPNPSVASAAIAAITRNIAIRAGSLVSPLHSPLRIAEEWSVVDNLSNGRVGISFAAGWQPNDFVFNPDVFEGRKALMFDQIDMVRRLWRGESLSLPNGSGETVEVRTLPRPVQPELPVWVTAAGNPETFEAAARVGANVLTHLLGQKVEDVAEKVELYRRVWKEAGHPGRGTVTLMLHTFIGESDEGVKTIVREPMKRYLRSAVGLIREAAWSFPTFKESTTGSDGGFSTDALSPEEMDALLDFSFERYFQTSGLLGSPDTCRGVVERCARLGVDEIACLVDFGPPEDLVLKHLPRLGDLAALFDPRERDHDAVDGAPAPAADESIPALIERHGVTHLQCTPSMAQILVEDPQARRSLGRLRQMLVGGEALSLSLARQLTSLVGGEVLNVYGPTETTIWSSVAAIGAEAEAVSIGRPLANTRLHVLDGDRRLTPVGVPGELFIGGRGVARGYWQREDQTAERFVPDPFGAGRLYRTGDRVRRLPDGRLEYLGRLDFQVKLRGHRIELAEIEARLCEHPGVRAAVALVREDTPGIRRLVAYLVPAGAALEEADVRRFLRDTLPEHMVPEAFVSVPSFPQTPNRKIDRRALPRPERGLARSAPAVLPAGALEEAILESWREVLGRTEIGVEDNFADLGGHSLLMVRVLSLLKERLARPPTLVDLFQHTTIRSIARFLASEEGPVLDNSAERAAARRAAATQMAERRRARAGDGRGSRG